MFFAITFENIFSIFIVEELHYNGSWRVFTTDMTPSLDLDGSFINVISHSRLQFFLNSSLLQTVDCDVRTALLKALFLSPFSNFATDDFNSLTCS